MKLGATISALALFAALSAPAAAADLYSNGGYKDGAGNSGSATYALLKGFWIGGDLGGAITSSQFSGLASDYSFAGFAGRASVGYDMSAGGNWVFGPYAEIGGEDASLTIQPTKDVGIKVTQRLEYGAGGRVGYQYGTTLFSLAVGWEGLEIDAPGSTSYINGIAITPSIEAGIGNICAGCAIKASTRWTGFYNQTLDHSGGIKLTSDVIEPMVGLTIHFGR